MGAARSLVPPHRVTTAPWLAPQRNGAHALTLGWGTARLQGTSHPAHPGQTRRGSGQPRGKGGAAPGPSSQTSGRASGVTCSKGTHALVRAHTQGLPSGLRAERDTCDAPSARPTQPQGTSAVSALQLCGFWLPELTHARTYTHSLTHTPHPHTESTAHAHGTRPLRALPGAPAPRRCRSSLQPLPSHEGRPGAPTPIMLSRCSGRVSE